MSEGINLIAAVSLNGVIGNSETNAMPWHLPSDLRRFRETTFNRTVLMGFNTYESIGRPLKSRKNIVITGHPSRAARVLSGGVDVVYSSVYQAAKNERHGFFAIGGAGVYSEALSFSPNRMYITVVNEECDGDVKFPIVGKRFLQDSLTVAKTGDVYFKEEESEWFLENGVQFKFVVFKLKDE